MATSPTRARLHSTSEFLAGVIEGFYGPTWTQEERFQLSDWMAQWGLNTYMYAPKDDLRQRAAWREMYPAAESKQFIALLRRCRRQKIRFIYGLSPGLDIRYCRQMELHQLEKRFDQMLSLGCRNFALLFDDIPEQVRAADLQHFGSLASAQSHIANETFKWLRQRWPRVRLFFCPTAYCGRMAAQGLGGEQYLATLGRELLSGIDVFWTGPEIISPEITVKAARELAAVLRRKPLVWDNLHANDYDGRRFFCGPYAGRRPELRKEIAGVLSNPNNELALNYVPLRTLAEFVCCRGTWEPRQAYLRAMRAWLRSFAVCGPAIRLEDLILFGDCYYLPYQEGPEGEALCRQVKATLANRSRSGEAQAAFLKRATRLREFCVRLSNLRNRRLFAALSRRVWELREELDLLERFVELSSGERKRNGAFRSDSHLPGTYRGGLVARLQQLLVQHADGTFTSALQDFKHSKRNNRMPSLP